MAVLVREPEGKIPPVRLTCSQDDNIKTNLKKLKWEGTDRITLDQDSDTSGMLL